MFAHKRGEIATILMVATLIFIGVASLTSSYLLNNKPKTTSTKAAENCVTGGQAGCTAGTEISCCENPNGHRLCNSELNLWTYECYDGLPNGGGGGGGGQGGACTQQSTSYGNCTSQGYKVGDCMQRVSNDADNGKWFYCAADAWKGPCATQSDCTGGGNPGLTTTPGSDGNYNGGGDQYASQCQTGWTCGPECATSGTLSVFGNNKNNWQKSAFEVYQGIYGNDHKYDYACKGSVSCDDCTTKKWGGKLQFGPIKTGDGGGQSDNTCNKCQNNACVTYTSTSDCTTNCDACSGGSGNCTGGLVPGKCGGCVSPGNDTSCGNDTGSCTANGKSGFCTTQSTCQSEEMTAVSSTQCSTGKLCCIEPDTGNRNGENPESKNITINVNFAPSQPTSSVLLYYWLTWPTAGTEGVLPESHVITVTIPKPNNVNDEIFAYIGRKIDPEQFFFNNSDTNGVNISLGTYSDLKPVYSLTYNCCVFPVKVSGRVSITSGYNGKLTNLFVHLNVLLKDGKTILFPTSNKKNSINVNGDGSYLLDLQLDDLVLIPPDNYICEVIVSDKSDNSGMFSWYYPNCSQNMVVNFDNIDYGTQSSGGGKTPENCTINGQSVAPGTTVCDASASQMETCNNDGSGNKTPVSGGQCQWGCKSDYTACNSSGSNGNCSISNCNYLGSEGVNISLDSYSPCKSGECIYGGKTFYQSSNGSCNGTRFASTTDFKSFCHKQTFNYIVHLTKGGGAKFDETATTDQFNSRVNLSSYFWGSYSKNIDKTVSLTTQNIRDLNNGLSVEIRFDNVYTDVNNVNFIATVYPYHFSFITGVGTYAAGPFSSIKYWIDDISHQPAGQTFAFNIQLP